MKDTFAANFAMMTIVLCLLLAVGCALWKRNTPTIATPPEYTDSTICAIAAKTGLTPEQLDTMLLDASLIPVATKQVQAAQMRAAIAKVRALVDGGVVATMAALTSQLATLAHVDPALMMLLSRKIDVLTSVPELAGKVFSPADKKLILIHLDHQAAQFSNL